MSEVQKNYSLSTLRKHPKVRSAIISFIGGFLHSGLSWRDENLEATAQGYLDKTNTTINSSEKTNNAINALKEKWKWIIIANHESWVFSDYLPLFSLLTEEILKNCIFYTASHNLAMNKREFPDYEFRPAKAAKLSIKNLENDIRKIEKDWWYIFLIPAWENTDDDAPFLWIFKKIIENSTDELPILASRVSHKHSMGYMQIWQAILQNIIHSLQDKMSKNEETKQTNQKNLWTTTISAQLTSSEEWKKLDWTWMRSFYNKVTV